MAAAKLVTRCPACRTAFRLVADQLRLRGGLVRCGHCETVFDAREHLVEVAQAPGGTAPGAGAIAATNAPDATNATNATSTSATGSTAGIAAATAATAAAASPVTGGTGSTAGSTTASTTAPATTPNTTPASTSPLTVEAALAHAERTQAVARAHAAAQPFDPGFDPGYEVPSLDSPTMMMAEPEALPGPDDGPDVGPDVGPDRGPDWGPGRGSDDGRDAGAEATEATVATEATEAMPPAMVPIALATPEPEPIEPSLPPEPWPTLDHAAFGDTAPPARTPTPPAADTAADRKATPETPPAGLPVAGAYSAKQPWPALVPAAHEPEPVRSASEFLRAADPTPGSHEAPAGPDAAWAAIETELTAAPDTAMGVSVGTSPGSGSGIGSAGAVAGEPTARHWLRRHGGSGPLFAPDFLRHTRGPGRQRAHRVALPGSRRGLARVAVAVLALGALLEGTYLARSQLAGSVPALRPLLEAACAPLHCDVPPWRDLEALRIDSSQLQKQDDGNDVYQLAVTMRNQGRATTALPAIELVMTDLQDQLLLRRVLQPSEYLEPAQRGFAATGLRAGSELPVRVRFRTQQTAANYRVLIFYP